MSQKSNKRMNQLCATAGEKIDRILSNVDSIYLEYKGGARLQIPINAPTPRFYDGIYTGYSFGTYMPGTSWVRSGGIKFVEWPHKSQKNNGSSTAKYQRYFSKSEILDTDQLNAKIAVTGEKITTEADKGVGIYGYEVTIRIRDTGEITAINRYFYNKKTMRICGQVLYGSFSDMSFLYRALGF
jgi:hypothetical protein